MLGAFPKRAAKGLPGRAIPTKNQAKEIIMLTRESDFCFFPPVIPILQNSDFML